jgi:hypothetical protein
VVGLRAPKVCGRRAPTAHAGSILAGRYKLIEEIADGGLSTVFTAQQTKPMRRAVAVGIINVYAFARNIIAAVPCTGKLKRWAATERHRRPSGNHGRNRS